MKKFTPVISIVAFLAIIFAIFYFGAKFLGESHQKTNDQTVTISTPVPTEEVSDLKIEDLTVGDGDEAKEGDTVSVNYLGTLLDGTKFDSSYDRGTPFSFKIGAGQVIKGWDQGVPGMKVGGKRKLTIPADLAYGDRGAGNVIKPGDTLVFEVELMGIEK